MKETLNKAMLDRRAQCEDQNQVMYDGTGSEIEDDGTRVRHDQACDDRCAVEQLHEHFDMMNAGGIQLAEESKQYREADEAAESKVKVLAGRLKAKESCLKKHTAEGQPVETLCQYSFDLVKISDALERLRRVSTQEIEALKAHNDALRESEASAVRDAVKSDIRICDHREEMKTLKVDNDRLDKEREFLSDIIAQEYYDRNVELGGELGRVRCKKGAKCFIVGPSYSDHDQNESCQSYCVVLS